MNYQQKDWLGSWQNFESYLVSTAPAMQACWTQAEEAAKALPMFQEGVKTFWQRACGTDRSCQRPGPAHHLAGCCRSAAGQRRLPLYRRTGKRAGGKSLCQV